MPGFVYFDGAAILTYGSTSAAGSIGTPVSFAGMTFPGTADATRIIVVAVRTRVLTLPTAVTIGGVGATLVVQHGNSLWKCQLWAAVVPTGASGTVTVSGHSLNSLAADNYMAVSTYAINGAASSTAASTGMDLSTGTINLTVPVGGCVIGAVSAQNNVDITWTNVTEDPGEGYLSGFFATTGVRYSHASAGELAGGVLAVTCAPSGTFVFVAAAWS